VPPSSKFLRHVTFVQIARLHKEQRSAPQPLDDRIQAACDRQRQLQSSISALQAAVSSSHTEVTRAYALEATESRWLPLFHAACAMSQRSLQRVGERTHQVNRVPVTAYVDVFMLESALPAFVYALLVTMVAADAFVSDMHSDDDEHKVNDQLAAFACFSLPIPRVVYANALASVGH
jgi:hypothetical protein